MVKHIVTFKLKGDAATRRAVAAQFKEALMKLPAVIDVLESIEVGLNDNPAEDWDVALIARVPRMVDIDTYARHPEHLKAAAIVAPYKEARACIDFEEK